MTRPARRPRPEAEAQIALIPAGIAVRIAALSLLAGLLGGFAWVLP